MKILTLTRDYPSLHSFVSLHETIFACTNPPLEAVKTGKAIKLVPGRVSIQRILERLPDSWSPDLIQVSSTLGVFTNPAVVVTGLQNLGCPSVMKLTDSHFRHRPIQSLIEYAQIVGCHYHWTNYDRHHLHFFKEAGLPNVFWMPGAISIKPYQVQLAPKKLYDVIFCGANSPQLHPRRAKLLDTLQAAGIDVTITRKSYTDSLDAYAASKIVFNCSLNGDLNRRVFETLMTGSFLLTDRLPPESGLPSLFQEGVHLECYGSEEELVDKAKYYLEHPQAAAKIAQQGYEKMISDYYPAKLEAKFLDFVVHKEPIPGLFLAEDDSRISQQVSTKKDKDKLRDRVRIYELLHELHRHNSNLKLLYYKGNHQTLLSDLKDLNRLEIVQVESVVELTQHSANDFDIVMIDCPESYRSLTTGFKELQPYLSSKVLLLILGQAAKRFNSALKTQGWNLVQLTESGEGACFSYQKLNSDDLNLPDRLYLPLANSLSPVQLLVLKTKSLIKYSWLFLVPRKLA